MVNYNKIMDRLRPFSSDSGDYNGTSNLDHEYPDLMYAVVEFQGTTFIAAPGEELFPGCTYKFFGTEEQCWEALQ